MLPPGFKLVLGPLDPSEDLGKALDVMTPNLRL